MTNTRTECITLLCEALTFGTAGQRRLVKHLVHDQGMTMADLIEDMNPLTDAQLFTWVQTVGYGVE
jgi:hypothetical protein